MRDVTRHDTTHPNPALGKTQHRKFA